ncbi:MAG TPA: hypothetical protein VEC12_12035, partial [Bacteroidia bacterium]|nr:hypothetical protein [Bacteroidia bacterium]
MKNIYRIAGLLCLFICCKTSFAGNILGAEITYKHVAGDSFDVSLRVYRDCNGSGTIDPTVEISNTCTTYNQSLALISSRDATGIPQNCPQQSKCSSGSFKYGIEERIYRDRVKLDSGSCNYYNLCWTRDSLSDSITTGYAGQPLFVCAYIALSANPANSSAEFNFPPKFFLNYGKDAHINLSAADIDADSVSYELVGFNSTVWMPSYPYSRPFTYLGFPITSLNFPAGIHLDSSFGILRFRPVSKGQVGVYSVRVKEWRKIAGVATVVGMVSRL